LLLVLHTSYIVGLSMFVFSQVEHAVEAPVEEQVEEPDRRMKKQMSEELRKQDYQALLAKTKNGRLGKKDTKIVADQFDVHIRAVQHL
jgi:hypothetical protein